MPPDDPQIPAKTPSRRDRKRLERANLRVAQLEHRVEELQREKDDQRHEIDRLNRQTQQIHDQLQVAEQATADQRERNQQLEETITDLTEALAIYRQPVVSGPTVNASRPIAD